MNKNIIKIQVEKNIKMLKIKEWGKHYKKKKKKSRMANMYFSKIYATIFKHLDKIKCFLRHFGFKKKLKEKNIPK